MGQQGGGGRRGDATIPSVAVAVDQVGQPTDHCQLPGRARRAEDPNAPLKNRLREFCQTNMPDVIVVAANNQLDARRAQRCARDIREQLLSGWDNVRRKYGRGDDSVKLS